MKTYTQNHLMVEMEGVCTRDGVDLATITCTIYKDSEVKEETARWGLEEHQSYTHQEALCFIRQVPQVDMEAEDAEVAVFTTGKEDTGQEMVRAEDQEQSSLCMMVSIKMIVQILDGIVYCMIPYITLDEARECYAPDIILREVPDDIPEGTGYDLETDSLVANDALTRHRSNEIVGRKKAVEQDYLSALKAIRKGDPSKDWEARATAIEAYLDALDAVLSQAGYPITVEWPEYPTKP